MSCPARLPGVLRVVYLIFTEGYAASAGADLMRPDLADEAIRLARILHRLLPGEREVAGLLALLLLIDARRAARVDADGAQVLLDDQDRALWDADAIAEGQRLVVPALTGRASALRRAGGDRGAARRGARPGRHRLAADRGALRRAAAAHAVAAGGAQPGHGRRDGRRARARASRCSTRWPTPPSCAATTCCPPPAPSC